MFSMKDMAQNQNVNDLVKAGVASLKIEGRKKNSLYVASVTDYYRKILDGETSKYKLENLNRNIRTIFSRGQTDLYMHNRKNSGVIDRITSYNVCYTKLLRYRPSSRPLAGHPVDLALVPLDVAAPSKLIVPLKNKFTGLTETDQLVYIKKS